MAHWKRLGLQFDAVYSGYLGSFEQVSIVRDFIGTFRSEGTLVLVDPAMADGGKLYKTFDPPFVEEMKSLCMHADLIVPNITEAAMLTGETYREGPYDKAYIERLLHGLLLLGAKQAVLTGVWFDEKQYGAGKPHAWRPCAALYIFPQSGRILSWNGRCVCQRTACGADARPLFGGVCAHSGRSDLRQHPGARKRREPTCALA